jgi:putative ABC transport system permease protein
MRRSARAAKVAGDLRASTPRTALVSLSIAVGVAAVGTVAGARATMLHSLDRGREEARFGSATFRVSGVVPQIVARVRAVPGVDAAVARHAVGVRVDGRTMVLFALDDYHSQPVARIRPQSGAWPPPPDAMLVERLSGSDLGVGTGGSLTLELPSGARHAVRVAGLVHDLNVPSTRTSGIAYGYVTSATLRRLGDRDPPNQLDIAVAGDRRNVERVAASVRRLLSGSGLDVRSAVVPEPGEFWANDPVQSMILLLTVLAVVCLLLSAFLVANIVSALVAQQIRQIGVMKAVGAGQRQTAVLYLSTALVYGAMATVVGVPIAVAAALALVTYSTGLINLDIGGWAPPPHVLALELAAGLVLPVVAAVAPVLGGSRITVRDAIARHGLEGRANGLVERLVGRAPALPSAIRLALTNTFRRKRRLLLTLSTLVLAGSVFAGVLSVRASMLGTLDSAATYRGYDIEVDLDRGYPAEAVQGAAAAVPGVVRTEGWAVSGAYRRRPDGSESQTFSVIASPARGLLHPSILRGRWLDPADTDAVVVNTDVLDTDGDLQPGTAVVLVVDGRPQRRHVVGVARRIVAGPVLYANRAPGADIRRLVVVTGDHAASAQSDVARRLAERLTRDGFRVGSERTTGSLRALDRTNFGLIVTFLLAMAILLAVVGGLGLAGTLSINVLERSREIGVLRAIGAGNGDVVQLVLVEGLIVAVLGWLISAPLALPIGRALSSAVGRLFLGAPLEFHYSLGGAFVWLGLLLVLAAAASLLPVRLATRLTVRDVLAWE